MSRIYKSAEELIGGTPLVKLAKIKEKYGLAADLIAKVEAFNPAGSAKDRVAKAMLDDAEAAGRIGPGSVIIEPTSGNTGIGLASVAAIRGYRAIIVMPDSMSVERQRLMTAYGAELVLTPGAGGMAAAIAKAEQLASEIPGGFVAGQFVNPANARAHYETTGPEIWQDTGGDIAAFVAGVGTGGTITGTGRYLKEQDPTIKVIAVEPEDSPVLTGGQPGPHGLQGIGAGFVPDVLDTGVYDEVIRITTDEAYEAGRMLGRTEGMLVGISSGAALSAAMQVAARPDFAGKNVVVLLPDTGERYLTTAMFAEQTEK